MSATNDPQGMPRRMADVQPADAEESPEEIRADIEDTRSSMSSTIDAIQEKLNPDTIKAQVEETIRAQVEQVKEHVTDAVHEQVETVKENVHDATIGRVQHMVSSVTGGSPNRMDDGTYTYRSSSSGGVNGVLDMLKQNPMPTALMGLGLAMLLRNRNTSTQHSSYSSGNSGGGYAYRTGYGDDRGYNSRMSAQSGPSPKDKLGDVAEDAKDRLGDVTGTAKDKASNLASTAGDQIGELRDRAGDQFSNLGDTTQEKAGQAKSWLDQNLQDNPMVVGAAALVLGLAAGMSLPNTPVEDRLLGETRDNLLDQAKSQAQDTFQKVSQVAQEVGGQVKETATQTAKQEVQKQGLVPQQ